MRKTLSTESRRPEVRPWALDELALPATPASGEPGLGGASYGGASYGGAPYGGGYGYGADDLGAGDGGLGGYGLDGLGGYAADGLGGTGYADLPPLPGAYGQDGLSAERLETERAEAAAEGYSRGYADGERAARAEREPAVEGAAAMLAEALEAVRAHEARWQANLEENVAALAVLVARHVLQREVTADATAVRGLVAGALAQFPLDESVTVRAHPEDLQACRALLGESAVPLPEARWVADPAVGRGGCLVEGRERILDGRLDVALERAYRALAGIAA